MGPFHLSLACAAGLVLGSCSDSSGPEAADPRGGSSSELLATRPYDASLLPAIEALERGDAGAAARALEGAPEARVGVRLLRARLSLLDGDPVHALSLLEEARKLGPEDDRVYATGAELYAALGRRSAAEEEVRRGWAAVGKTPALERARGILNLTVPGAVGTGWASLEAAWMADPGLPFLKAPLAEANVLIGRSELTSEEYQKAHRRATRALELAPLYLDAKELLAEAKAALLDYEGALLLYDEIEAAGGGGGEGRALLHHRAATFGLLQGKDHGVIVRHYLTARELGMNEEELGHGATLLAQEAEAELDRGIERFEEGDLAGAERAFLWALELAPRSLEAKNHLAAVRFRLGRYLEAAEGWAEVLTEMRAQGLELVDPLPLNLARAWRNAGEVEVALQVMADYCEREPEGPWAAQALEMRGRLAAEVQNR